MNQRNISNELYDLLKYYSNDHADRFKALYIDNIRPDMSEVDQIRSLNTYWRIQLGMLNKNTIQVRSCLVDDIPADMWLFNFKNYIIGEVVKNSVPIIPWINYAS